MYGNRQKNPSGVLNLQMGDIIEFPQRANNASEHDHRPTRPVSNAQSSLAEAWNQADSAHGQCGVPADVLNTLQQLMAQGCPGALCVLRLDEYRLLEETFGRRIGQALLKLITRRLRSALRSGNLLAQIAQDEFVLILDGQLDKQQLAEQMGLISSIGQLG